MNKLKKVLLEKGEWIGEGSDRTAYLFNNKIWKIVNRSTLQNKIEQEVIQRVKKENIKNSLIPEITYVSNNICFMDEVLIASEDKEFEEYCSDNDMTFESIDSYISFVGDVYGNIDRNSIFEELEELEKVLGVVDISTNADNFGRIGNRILVTDLGFSSTDPYGLL